MNWYNKIKIGRWVYRKPLEEEVDKGIPSFIWDRKKSPDFDRLPPGYEVVQRDDGNLAVVAPPDYQGQPEEDRQEIVRGEYSADNFADSVNFLIDNALTRIKFMHEMSN